MTDSPDRPLPESYWVIPGQFLAGEYPGSFHVERTRQRIDALIGAGFNTFIDLTTAGELPPYNLILREQAVAYNVRTRYHRFPIGDFGVPSRAHMQEILYYIDDALGGGRKIYMHCWGGVGRTGTTVGCFFAHRGESGEAALARLAALWQTVPKSAVHPRSPETDQQMDFVRNWKE